MPRNIWGKGHPNYYKGKLDSIDPIDFMNNFNLYANGLLNQKQFAENLGISVPTLIKHSNELYTRAMLMIQSGEAVYVYPEKKEEK